MAVSTRTSSSTYRRNRRAVLSASTICHLCGEDGATTVDHLLPYSLGGTDDVGNLAPAHLRCNLSRGTRPLTTYREEAA